MKLSDVRRCDNCANPLAPNGTFYVVRLSMAMVDRQAYQQVAGLATMFGGNVALAEAFAPTSDTITILGDKEPQLMTELLICQECFLKGPIDLAILREKRGRISDTVLETTA